MNKRKTFSLLLLSLFCTTLFGQNKHKVKDSVNVATCPTLKEIELQDVVVTATRSLRQLSSLPLPAQLISKREIARTNSVRLIDILNEQTGLVTVSDYGGGEGVQLQGMDSQYTLILIDGVPLVGRLAGTLDLGRLSVGNIKQIEVIKGASSSLYGNEALGGVINIITDRPSCGFGGDVYLRGDNFLTFDMGSSLNYQKDKLDLSLFVNRYQSQGYDLDKSDDLKTIEPYRNHTVSLKGNYTFSPQTKLLLSGRYYNQNQDMSIKNPSTGKFARGEGTMHEWNSQMKLSHTFSKEWKSFLEVYATRYSTKQHYASSDNSLKDNNSFNQLLVKPELRIIYQANKNHQLTSGLGLTYEKLEKSYFIKVPDFTAFYSYLQYDAEFFDHLNVITGLRFDKHSEYGSVLSPKIALRYKINDQINLRASVGYGFKTPDFRQLYNNFTNNAIGYTVLGYKAVPIQLPQMLKDGEIAVQSVGLEQFNGTLSPESSIAYNLGFDYKINQQIHINANFFRNDIKNMIDTYTIATKTNNLPVFAYHNISRVYTQGIEANIKYKITRALHFSAGYQYLYAKDKDAVNQFEAGEIYASQTDWSAKQLKAEEYFGLFNRSRHMVNMKLFYRIPQWGLDMNLRAVYRSKYGLSDSNGNSYLDSNDQFINGYTLWNFAANKTFYRNYQLSLGVNNLLNYTNKRITNIPGRIIYAKVYIKF